MWDRCCTSDLNHTWQVQRDRCTGDVLEQDKRRNSPDNDTWDRQ